MSGEISLTSELGKGSQFRFYTYFESVPPMAEGEKRTKEVTTYWTCKSVVTPSYLTKHIARDTNELFEV